MTTRAARAEHGSRSTPPAASPPAPLEYSQPCPAPAAERLAYSVAEAARLTGLSRDPLYDEMRRGNLAYRKVGRRRLITRQHLEQFLEGTPSPGQHGGTGDGPQRTGPGAS